MSTIFKLLLLCVVLNGTVPAPRVTVPATVPVVVPVTVPAVEWNGAGRIVNGEPRPGVRSPEVWELTLSQAEQTR